MIDFEKLWKEKCKEKQELDLEIINLKNKIKYLETENKTLGIISNEYRKRKKSYYVDLLLFLDDLKTESKDFECCEEIIERIKKEINK